MERKTAYLNFVATRVRKVQSCYVPEIESYQFLCTRDKRKKSFKIFLSVPTLFCMIEVTESGGMGTRLPADYTNIFVYIYNFKRRERVTAVQAGPGFKNFYSTFLPMRALSRPAWSAEFL